MRSELVLAAVAEAATGVALLIVPSLVGELLLGAELTDIAVPVARVAGIALIGLGIACWPGPPRVGMLIYKCGRHTVSRLRRPCRRIEWQTIVAGGRSALDPDSASDSGINK